MDEFGEERLMRAVICRAVADALCGYQCKRQVEAMTWVANNDLWFRYCSYAARLDPDAVRGFVKENYGRVAGRGLILSQVESMLYGS